MIVESDLKAIADPRDQRGYVFHMTPFRRLITAAVRGIFPALGNIVTEGVENLPDHGAVVLACNHLTNFDVFPMQLALPRPIYFMGKAELFQNPVLETVLRNLGGFPVYRGERDEWALRHAARVLEHGQVLGIFPEGTRSKGGGLKAGKSGAARFAIEANCPVVPMGIDGSQHIFKRFPRPAVRIKLGKPFYPGVNDSPLRVTEDIMFAIAALLPPHLRGVYSERPKGF